ncbi:hypothetical protein [methanotrophic endosymbiont of Bathymodiolus puteoserpentis (Logatchev)]|jgi:hypothetical protein|uniref:hypothetical protein n=1 Tax=methanotrophic endosymbiont of Bathymodiolus puteoserpentis (Logatchev) TaxID=343235 RepID=UPI0013CA0772|nr:hypothetical protein [methanotrophic endosymbiont of Bathymodiolus puteoserpentis (Logatchev)]SHE22050.1 hypothetical protein BPUTEOMOX_2535 [methanotrophic endosymbiont of Bathymodiolus puteoserpentis (Logatchev)]
MSAIYESSTVEASRLAFIDTLTAEFTMRTGVGVYVYLTPVDINSLFRRYLKERQTIAIFVRQYVRNYSIENNI